MSIRSLPFNSIYRHGFIRAAVCIPHVKVADPVFNTDHIIALAKQASDAHATVTLFPELCISAYSNDDLFHQDALLDAVQENLLRIVEASKDVQSFLLVGAPLQFDSKLFNCAVGIYRGKIYGIIPKTYLPNYREFYEKRQFTSGRDRIRDDVGLFGESIPFGENIIFHATTVPGLTIHAEICEDLWAPIPPSTYAALAGASVLCNLSASNITIGKAEYRRDLCAAQSGKMIAAYLYTAAGQGESTTDLAWDGHGMIYENDERLAESDRFAANEQMIVADIDLERLAQDRMRTNSFNDAVREHTAKIAAVRRVPVEFIIPEEEVNLRRETDRFPYVPNDPTRRAERCYEAYNIQVQGLITRMKAANIKKIVLGVSGGLDSTQALIVAARAMDRLSLPRTNILAWTLPGYATGSKTLGNAHDLMNALGVTSGEIDIRPSCRQMLKDIKHPFVDGEPVYDITFENVQAGARTSLLFRLANYHNGMVLGTGDLSELALGWTTYGVGDHMSHYNVNASVPKTLIQYMIGWIIDSGEFSDATNSTLRSILETEISPELIPGSSAENESGNPSQKTEDKIGPYELQDFNLYYISRYGFRPSKVAYLAYHAWHNKSKGEWPANIAKEKRNEYDIETIKKWLKVFLWRFFATSQFKRSAVPNGPKVGSGGSLSPRGDWRAPSDSSAQVWLDELESGV